MNRYERQTALAELGEQGQARLAESKVLIVGVGGLGSPIALYLTAAGVGTIGLMDDDVVSEHNLQRQVLFTEVEIGQLKAERAKLRLAALNHEVTFHTYARLTPENAETIIAQYDVVVDGCDNFATRYLINRTCRALQKPYIYGAIQGFVGQVSVFGYGEQPHWYTELYPETETFPIVADRSVMGVTPGIVGCTQANETLKVLAGYGTPLVGKLWNVDLRTMDTFTIDF